jgi:uncharacterized protein YegP (UPF0339 family)
VTGIVVFKGHDKRWYFHKIAANHQVVLQSQGYGRRRDARLAAARQFPGVPIQATGWVGK